MEMFNNKNEIKKYNRKKYKRKKYKISQFLICLILLIILIVPFKNEVFLLNPISKSLKLKAEPPEIGEVGKPEIGDVVYYNQLFAEDVRDEKYQKAVIPKGDAKNPGWGGDLFDWDEWTQNNWSENKKKHVFRDKIVHTTSNPDERTNSGDTTWRVWDILPDGSYVLISNKLVSNIKIQGPVGYLWWEHTAHFIASTYGYGFGANTKATKDFEYSVGSKIDNAPDMIEGDKGIWHIGQNGIPVSGSRSLTIEDVEEKLGIDEEKINIGYMNIRIDGDVGQKYNQKIEIRSNFIPQRDIGSKNQDMDENIQSWMYTRDDKSYTTRTKSWILNQNDINFENLDEENKKKNPNLLKYKSMLFDNRLTEGGHPFLANTGLMVFGKGKKFTIGAAYVSQSSSRLGFVSPDAAIASTYDGVSYLGDPIPDRFSYIYVLTYLKPNLVFERAAIDPKYELPEGLKAWDIKIEKNKKDINFIVNNYAKENAQNLNIDLEKEIVEKDIAEETKIEKIEFKGINEGKEKYGTKLIKYSGGTRKYNIDDAKFNPIDNKYKLSISNLPSSYDFKIIDRKNEENKEGKKEVDLRNDINNMVGDTGYEYDLIVFPKNKDISIPVVYEGGKEDPNFEVNGNIKVTTGDPELDQMLSDELKNKAVTLKNGVDSIYLKDIPLFNHLKNELTTIKIEFTKNETDKGKHVVTVEDKSEGADVPLEEKYQIKVKYEPDKINIKATLTDDTETNLKDLDMYLVSKVDGKTLKKKEIKIKLDGTILDADGNALEPLNKTTNDGEKITYSVEKKQILLGNVIEIKEGIETETEKVFNIRVRPVLKLPMTGKDNLTKVAIAATTLMILSFIFQSTSKHSIFYEEYSIIK